MTTAAVTDPSVTTICFHGIGRPTRPAEMGEERFWITSQSFLEMMDVLREHRDVIITFDDANESDYTHALPVLTDLGTTATFFVIAGRIGTPGSLSSRQVQELAGSGMNIGSHGMDHVPWCTLADGLQRRREFVEAKERLEETIEGPVREAACPNGSYNRTVLRGLRHAGFERVYTVDGGPSRASSWIRDRYSVTRHDTAETLAAYLAAPGGGIWTQLARRAKGLIKRWR